MRKNSGNKSFWKHSEKGQSLVEFSASIVVLLLILSGVVDIGRAFFTFVAIENGAGEGALFASYHPAWVTEEDATDGGASNPEYDNITYRAAHESPGGVVDWSNATVSVAAPDIQVGAPVTVTMSYSYTLITPFLNLIVNDGILPLHAQATQMILNTN